VRKGVGHAAVLLRLAGPRPGAAPRQPAAPDSRLVRAIVDMGFSQVGAAAAPAGSRADISHVGPPACRLAAE
jgi:hypothetical protein